MDQPHETEPVVSPPSQPTQTLSQIKALLAAHGLRPRKRFGQNFLHDANHLDRIVAAAELSPGELVLEVGPGTGALTLRLLAAGARVVAVEVDRDLEPPLRQVLEPFGQSATLLIADVLAGKHALNPAVLDALRRAGCTTGFKLVANLPYNVASPLLANMVLQHAASTQPNMTMTMALVMVQREVAARLLAGPGGKDYGPLGIVIQAGCEVELISRLSPGCFWPVPGVESAVLRLRPRAAPLCGDWADLPAYSAFVGRLFRQRRKQLGRLLGREQVLSAGIDPSQRPETLGIDKQVALWRSLGPTA